MASPLGLLSRLSQRLGSRGTTRARKSGADSERTPTPAQLVFETFEPRLLLAADPLGITAGYAFNEVSGNHDRGCLGPRHRRHAHERSDFHDRKVRQCSNARWRE